MFELLLAVAIVVFTSSLCSLFEAVLYSVPISHIESLVEERKTSGRILKKLRENVDKPITAILSLNTIANTAGAAIAGAIALKVLGSHYVIYFSICFTLIILVFSEVMPKTTGVIYSKPLSGVIARPLQILVWVFTPMVWLCGFATRLVFETTTEDKISGEEIIVLARLGLRAGTLDEDEASVIQNILSLETRLVRDVMTPRTVLYSLSGDLTAADALKEKKVLTHSRIPVYFSDKEDVVGIVHRRDVVSAMVEEKLDQKLESLMRPVDFVLDTDSLEEVLKSFLAGQQHLYVVVDEFGALSGVITLEDVLEEILGKEIVDEFDQAIDMRELARRRRERLIDKSKSIHEKKAKESGGDR